MKRKNRSFTASARSLSGLGAVPQDDVPARGELADPGVLDRGEVQAEGRVALRVAGPDLLELAVPLVPGEALDEALGRQKLLLPFVRNPNSSHAYWSDKDTSNSLDWFWRNKRLVIVRLPVRGPYP